jgi:hypothetical protein
MQALSTVPIPSSTSLLHFGLMQLTLLLPNTGWSMVSNPCFSMDGTQTPFGMNSFYSAMGGSSYLLVAEDILTLVVSVEVTSNLGLNNVRIRAVDLCCVY